MQIPDIGTVWKSPQGISMKVTQIHQRPKQPIFLTLEILTTKRTVLRTINQFEQFNRVEQQCK